MSAGARPVSDVVAGGDREDDGHRGAREDRGDDGADGGVGDGVRRGDPSPAGVDEVGHRDRAAAELVANDVRRVGGDHDHRQLRQPAQLSDHLVRARRRAVDERRRVDGDQREQAQSDPAMGRDACAGAAARQRSSPS